MKNTTCTLAMAAFLLIAAPVSSYAHGRFTHQVASPSVTIAMNDNAYWWGDYDDYSNYDDDDYYSDYEDDDDWYEDDEWDDYEKISFEEEKQWILEDLKYLLNEEDIQDANVRSAVQSALNDLRNLSNEDQFFDRLEELEEQLEPYFEEMYGDDYYDDDDWYEEDEWDDYEEISFDEERAWILEDLVDVQREIDDSTVRTQVRTLTEELRHIEDEDQFFETLEEIDRILEPYYEQFYDDEHFHDSFEGEYEGDTFSIDGDSVDGQPTLQQQEVWNRFITLIPASERQDLAEVLFFNEPDDGTAAFVEQLLDNATKWRLGINMAEAENQAELDHTLIHEFAHILTLNKNQVDASGQRFEFGDARQCTTFHTGEGCSNVHSYIHQFVTAFWGTLQGELDSIESIENDDEYYDALDAFYGRNSDQFVSDYAASNPGEDIAESFTAFVLRSKPTGNTIAEQKILFFYNYPELVELRGEIRRGL